MYIIFMMFCHVPKRLQLFFELRAIIFMPYESVPVYRTVPAILFLALINGDREPSS